MSHFTRCVLILLYIALAAWGGGCRLMQREMLATRMLEQSRLLSQQALFAMQRGDWQEADRLLVQALRTCPHDVEARARYARVLWSCGQKEQALKQMQLALQTAPDNVDLHVQMAEFRLELGQLDEAERHAQTAVRLSPKNASAWLIQGRVALAQNRRDDALAAFHRVLGLRPRDTEGLRWLAQAYQLKGDWEQVLAVRQRILETYVPGSEPAEELAALAQSYEKLGRWQDAVTAYLRAADRVADPAPYLLAAAEIELQNGNISQAQQLARRVLSIYPVHPQAQALWQRLENPQMASQSITWR